MNENRPMEMYYTNNGYPYQTSENYMGFFDGFSHHPLNYGYPPVPMPNHQSWTSRNPGRRFACCKVYNPDRREHGCKYWEWIDGEMVEWQRLVTNQLLLEKKLLEKEKELLKGEVCNLEDQKSNLLRDLDGLRRKCNQMAMEKKPKGKKKKCSVAWVVGFCICCICSCYSHSCY